ncbi:MAG TPA: histidine phosphatase family protein, partial [Pilimelia sp.]|nr:histidine phosphatase family protein [Pilimelia sp.]
MTTFLLVRHGATAHTALGRFSGSTGADPPLSTVGEEQAARLAASLRRAHHGGDRVDAVVSSPMRRARGTAEVLARALDLPVHLDGGLREVDFGAWEGRTVSEVARRWADDLAGWRSGADVAPHGGETVAAVARRVGDVRRRLARDHPAGTVLLVSHLYPVRLSILDALGAPLAAVHRMLLEPTALSELRDATLVRYNDAGHL